jgi:cystinosin
LHPFFTPLQYVPQVRLNYYRQSTEGFHIGGVLLDFSGGVLSLLQMDIYCVIEQSNKQLTGNIPKMALAIATLIFNIILIIQHYVLYIGNPIPELLSQSEENQKLVESKRSTLINSYHSINVDAETEEVDGPLSFGSNSMRKTNKVKKELIANTKV